MEEQLLYILGYDLRFDEREACAHFAPFMATCILNSCPLTPLRRENRTAAVERVHKSGRARAQSQPQTPPGQVPPPPLVGPSIMSTVRGITKRLPSSRLGGTQSLSNIASPVSSVNSYDSSSTTESEMGSLTEDTGSSSDSASSVSSDDDEASEERNSTKGQFTLDGGPPQAHRRNVSGAGSIQSIATVRACDSPKHSPLPLEACTIKIVNRAANLSKRAGSYVYGVSSGIQSDANSAGGYGYGGPAHRAKTSFNRSSNGFLSRMWSAAIKGEEKENLRCDLSGKGSLGSPAVSIIEPGERHPPGHGASAFQRLVQSRSAIFRATANQHLLNL